MFALGRFMTTALPRKSARHDTVPRGPIPAGRPDDRLDLPNELLRPFCKPDMRTTRGQLALSGNFICAFWTQRRYDVVNDVMRLQRGIMRHLWVEPLRFADPVLGVHHLVCGTGHALIFLCEKWHWNRDAAFHDAVALCSASFEAAGCPEDARDAFSAALVSAGLLDVDCCEFEAADVFHAGHSKRTPV